MTTLQPASEIANAIKHLAQLSKAATEANPVPKHAVTPPAGTPPPQTPSVARPTNAPASP